MRFKGLASLVLSAACLLGCDGIKVSSKAMPINGKYSATLRTDNHGYSFLMIYDDKGVRIKAYDKNMNGRFEEINVSETADDSDIYQYTNPEKLKEIADKIRERGEGEDRLP